MQQACSVDSFDSKIEKIGMVAKKFACFILANDSVTERHKRCCCADLSHKHFFFSHADLICTVNNCCPRGFDENIIEHNAFAWHLHGAIFLSAFDTFL